MPNPHIGSNPERDKEMKDKTDFATQSFPHEDAPLSKSTLDKIKKEFGEDKKEEIEPKNFPVNFISDEDFEKEKEYLPFTPQGESVIVLGPKVKLSKSVKTSQLELDKNTKRELLEEQLRKHKGGYRVIATSPFVSLQQMESFIRNAEMLEKLGGTLEGLSSPYKEGDYIFSKPGPNGLQVVRELELFTPLSEDLSYYQVFHREVDAFMTQEQALKFKPKEDETKGQE